MKVNILHTSLLITLLLGIGSLSADSVKINKTGTVFQNVKTSTEKGVVTVDFEDGSQKKFRTRDVTVTSSEVVWLAEEVEEPSFFQKLFSFGTADSKEDASGVTVSSDATERASDAEEESSIPFLAEGIFGGVALLFLILP